MWHRQDALVRLIGQPRRKKTPTQSLLPEQPRLYCPCRALLQAIRKSFSPIISQLPVFSDAQVLASKKL